MIAWHSTINEALRTRRSEIVRSTHDEIGRLHSLEIRVFNSIGLSRLHHISAEEEEGGNDGSNGGAEDDVSVVCGDFDGYHVGGLCYLLLRAGGESFEALGEN